MTGEPASTVLLSVEDHVATITINRPSVKNAIDVATWEALHDALSTVATDDAVRTVVVTGAGGDFCAGADLSGSRRDIHPLERMKRVNQVAIRLHELDKPTIAKVDGVAVGAGWNLALGCDLVAASTRARFSQIFARRGLSLDFGGSWLLPKLVGLQQAKRIALLADFLDVTEAKELGLVTWVAEPDELDGVVTEIAKQLAAGPPVALAQSKALLNAGADSTLREALTGEARAQAVNFATADAPAAFAAFRDKTEPEFTGRWMVP
ncbi:2-(1,2-epoxy-1,2-dihydrophenyl)acetyl-CoA isomerase [Tamaricihabitans halophyticus]|uniref:2-(1,2-epoxy-1,2-dihydrophenyl)acetyl-CoA isomerase n=1 Tax=Tamaricihabitans halophyticus TaxID=1262583 RepID=A0A4R2QKU8_9PSEU|nr:enoyl-CoA hydratase-related protein [Tamaricihabitans halophyticus]TCP50073.1 2-(1,2-epoxy-1,2-dihydrophenyl)acetyl-CoA isomerase [Tamaricihabitans halophyticus]